MAYSTRFVDNYVELYSYVYGQRQIYGDKLNLLRIEAKTLYTPANKTRALELQTEIRATEAYLHALDNYVVGLSDKYKKLAMSFNGEDASMFIDMFIDRKPIKEIASQYNMTEQTIRNKKFLWAKKIRSSIKKKVSLPDYARDGVTKGKIQK